MGRRCRHLVSIIGLFLNSLFITLPLLFTDTWQHKKLFGIYPRPKTKPKKRSTSEIICITKIQLKVLNFIMEHCPQCKESQILNVEDKNLPSLTKQRSTWQTRPRVFSTGNISTKFSTPIQNLSIHEKSTICPYQLNTSQESMCSFTHLCKPAHNVNFLPEQWQQIIPKLWGSERNWPSKTLSNAQTGFQELMQPSLHPLQFISSTLVISSWKQEHEAAVLNTWRNHLRKHWKFGFFY